MMAVQKLAGFLLLISLVGAEARDRAHLIPAGPNFDVNAPYARTYARLCEEKLFTGSDWMIRYHSVSEVAEIGLSITRKQDGKFRVTVKQSRPQLGSMVSLAYNLKLNLKSALETLKIDEAHAEIPDTVAITIRDYWISLLGDVRPYKQTSQVIVSNKVILFAKTTEGKMVSGRLPPDAYKYNYIHAVEDIVNDLMKVCVERNKSHRPLFNSIERKARTFAAARSKE